jgi:hypothetical protein
MVSPRFLFDENVSRILSKALRAQDGTIDIVCVGEVGGPPKGTLDPELLEMAETDKRFVVSDDRNTMPQHVLEHLANGRHTWGVALLRKGFSVTRYVQDLLLIQRASNADEWTDRIEYIPF